MRAAIGLALVAAVLSGVAYMAGRMATVERHLADTREALATQDYPQAAGSVDAATASLGWARYVPGFGTRVQREARAYNAAILYWEREYDTLVPDGQDPVSAIEEGNADLQLVVANAAPPGCEVSATATPLIGASALVRVRPLMVKPWRAS